MVPLVALLPWEGGQRPSLLGLLGSGREHTVWQPVWALLLATLKLKESNLPLETSGVLGMEGSAETTFKPFCFSQSRTEALSQVRSY